MVRYIDAELLKENFAKKLNKHYGIMLKIDDVAVDLSLAIADTPTADVVEVVRCKDCKCCEQCYPAKAIGEEAVVGWYCKIRNKYMQPDDFCSYGERRDE